MIITILCSPICWEIEIQFSSTRRQKVRTGGGGFEPRFEAAAWGFSLNRHGHKGSWGPMGPLGPMGPWEPMGAFGPMGQLH